MNELPLQHIQCWREIHQSRPELDSPFFAPEYSALVAKELPDLQVAVISQGGKTTGFFPFHRNEFGIGKPAGKFLNDFQGIVCSPELSLDTEHLLRASKLKGWEFNHLIASQRMLASYCLQSDSSPYISIVDGFDAYREARRRSGSHMIEQALRKERKLSREQGPLRFVWHTQDQEVFSSLLQWKGDQHRRTGVREVYQYPWVVRLLDRIRTYNANDFTGVVSALYAGDQLVAVHLGMRSRRVLHWWFPTFNPKFGRYSPGLLLCVMLIRQASEAGIERIDLGKGNEGYKESLMTGTATVVEGLLSQPGLTSALAGVALRTRHMIRGSSFRKPTRLPKKVIRQFEYWMARHHSEKQLASTENNH